MFMAAVFVVLAVDAVESWRGIRAAVLRYRPYIVVALLPPVLHVYYLRVHAPNGNFVGYNAVDPAMLAESYKLVEPTFVRSFLWPLLGSLESAVAVHDFVTMAGVCVVGAVLFLWRRLGCRSAGTMILSGALAWLLGSIPYNALGRMPAQDDWWSRDQLLLGLGAALLIVGTGYAATLARHTPRWLSGSAAVALIAYLAVSTHVALMRYQADWFKQESLGLAFEALPAVRDNTVFLITDETRALNVNQRYYRFYEYTGLLKRSFGDETRYAADYTAAEEQQIRSGTLFTPRHNHSYNLGGFRPTKDVVRLRIRYGSHGPELRDGGYWATAALLFDRFYRPTLYQAAIRNVVAVDVMDDGA